MAVIHSFRTVATALLFASQAVAQNGTAPATRPEYQVRAISFGGSGCPQGSNTSPSLKWTTFGEHFTAEFGDNAPITAQRKNCQINIDVAYPEGWQFSLPTTTVIGRSDLTEGVNALVRSTYYFSGSADQATTDLELQGPSAGYFSKTESSAVDIWSPCGAEGMININLSARLTGTRSNDTSVVRVESMIFNGPGDKPALSWRRCGAERRRSL